MVHLDTSKVRGQVAAIFNTQPASSSEIAESAAVKGEASPEDSGSKLRSTSTVDDHKDKIGLIANAKMQGDTTSEVSGAEKPDSLQPQQTLEASQDESPSMASNADARMNSEKNTGVKNADPEDLSQKSCNQLQEYISYLTRHKERLEEMKSYESFGPGDEKTLQDYKRKIKEASSAYDEKISIFKQMARNAMPLPSFPSTASNRANSNPKLGKVNKALKRKVQTQSAYDETSTNRPKKAKRMTKDLLKTKDVIAEMNFKQISGLKSRGKLDSAAFKDLRQLSKLPRDIQDHLDKIEAAALKNPHADKDTIEPHLRVLGGVTDAFNGRIEPWTPDNLDTEMELEDYRWRVEGLAHPLHSHQVVAAGHQLVLERDSKGLGSGFLFDYMGYGKTIEMLAVMTCNPPGSRAPKLGGSTTLVVVPKSAREQWQSEVGRHCPSFKVELWDDKLSSHDAFSADVLIITYPQLRSAFKKKDQKDRSHILFRKKTNFHRIVLDEGHEIRNPKSQTFEACTSLSAKLRWVVTGTPTPNRVSELFSYLKFIKHGDPNVVKLDVFKDYVAGTRGKGSLTANERLNELLDGCMIMRRPGHQFLGSALVKLPETHPETVYVERDTEETIIQAALDACIKDHILSKPSKNKGAKKEPEAKSDRPGAGVGWRVLNESLMRSRQLAASPLLLEKLVKERIWTQSKLKNMREEAHAKGCIKTPFIDLFEKWLVHPGSRRKPRGAAHKKAAAMLDRDTCPTCIKQQSDPQRAECGHIWCKKCIDEFIRFSRWKENSDPGIKPLCPRCSRQIGQYVPCVENDCETDEQPKTRELRLAERRKLRQRGDDFNGYQPSPDSDSTLTQDLDSNSEVPIPLSRKMERIVKQIMEWQEGAPDDKIIVFTQFLDNQCLMGRVCQDRGIGFLYYVGTMSDEERENAKHTFANVNEVKVMFVSLRCGGQALNLTCANRVIIADPWWNQCAEAQGIARVYRMGQKKQTYSVRFLVKDGIDERMYKLQLKKLDETRDALEEFSADSKLSLKNMEKLLGWRDDDSADESADDDEEYQSDLEEIEYDDDGDPHDEDYED